MMELYTSGVRAATFSSAAAYTYNGYRFALGRPKLFYSLTQLPVGRKCVIQ